jgi:FlgN protein
MHRLEALADTLWAERHLVEFLLFKLTAAKLLLAADERRFVALALDEVQRVLVALRGAETRRARAVEEVAAELHVPADQLTLSQLASHSPEPLRTVFRDHADGFLALATEIEETAALNRRLASATLSHVQRAIDALTGPPAVSTYTASGRPTTATAAPMRLDQVL